MRLIALSQVHPGTRLAKSIFSADGRVLLRKGASLHESYISRLKKLGFSYLYVEDHRTDGIEEEDSIPEEIRAEVVGRIKNVMDRLTDPDGMSSVIKSGQLGREFTKVYDVLYQHIRSNQNMVVSLSAIYSSDAHTYTHCMHVGVISTVLGLAHGYDAASVQQLGIGAMLHDIGKVEISPAIVHKPDKLSDEEIRFMRRHCQYGYDMLVKQPGFSERAAQCALYHHECYDGSGYPHGLAGEEIPEFARLLAVADVFDALTSNRPYRDALLPGNALEYMFSKSYSQFDARFLQLFVKHVNIYPIGMLVQLSNGVSGIVSRANEGNPQRPKVLALEEHAVDITPYEIDLSKELNITITGVIQNRENG